MIASDPPGSEAELLARARALTGVAVSELAAALELSLAAAPARRKGKVGELVELALGARGGGGALHDFPALGVELKTVPVDGAGRPRESTFVCAFAVADAAYADWATSRARAKLARVLFVPVVHDPLAPPRLGAPLLWRPTAAQDQGLGADFDDLMGLIGVGAIEELTAHRGRWLQVRPKAVDGRPRACAFGPEGEWLPTVPRGLYLRARFVGAVLADPTATP